MPSLHLGPVLRAIARQKSAFSLIVLELASGFTIISCLFLAATWYLHIGFTPSGHDEADLIGVFLVSPAASPDARVAAAAGAARQAHDVALMAAVPGVRSLAPVSSDLLDDRWLFPTEFRARGAAGPQRSFGWALYTSRGLADVLGLRFLEGDMGAGDERGTVITRCLRDQLFPGAASVLGQLIDAEDGPPARVIGVVENVVMRMPFQPHHTCTAFRFGRPADERESRYLVRAEHGRRQEVRAALAQALAVGPNSAPDRLAAVTLFDSSAGRHRSIASGIVVLLAIFGGIVGLIALLGAVSVSSFMVAERRRQIGIRRALGATRADIVRYFLIENCIATALGTGLGLLCTLALFMAMKPIFTGLELRWYAIVITALLLWFDATLAAMIPARRAADIPPSVASRGL